MKKFFYLILAVSLSGYAESIGAFDRFTVPIAVPPLGVGQAAGALNAEMKKQNETPQEEQPRDKGADAAKALAAAGAIFAAAMCAKMLADAQKLPPGPEKDEKVNQALQQCQQALQNAQNAAKNDGAKKGASSLGPGGEQFSPNPVAAASKQAAPELTQSVDEDAPEAPFLETGETIVPSEVPAEVAASSIDGGAISRGAVGEKTSDLEPIKNLKMDESVPVGGLSDSGNKQQAGFGFGAFSSGEDFFAKSGKEGANGKGGEDSVDSKNRKGGRGISADVEGSSFDQKASPRESAFDALLASMGATAEVQPAFAGAHAEILVLPGRGAVARQKGRGLNIFQFAAFRYRNAYTEGRVRPGTGS